MNPGTVGARGMNWAWGLPLIVLTVVLHAGGLRLIGNEINSRLSSRELLRHRSFAPVFAIGATALSVTLLHAYRGCNVGKTVFRLFAR